VGPYVNEFGVCHCVFLSGPARTVVQVSKMKLNKKEGKNRRRRRRGNRRTEEGKKIGD
jgi:hypothetical protein